MSLDNTITEWERRNLDVWDYPVSDRYTKVCFSLSLRKGLKKVDWVKIHENKNKKTYFKMRFRSFYVCHFRPTFLCFTLSQDSG